MCTVSVKVNEDVLWGVLPELENTAAIRWWAQMLVDARIRELVEETRWYPSIGTQRRVSRSLSCEARSE